jgi:hypothetical protein
MTEPDDVGDIAAGQLVELTGTYLGNPLEDVLAFLNTLIPYLIEQQEAQQEAMASTQSKIKAQKKSGNPARRAATEASGDEIAALLGEVMEKSKDAEQAMGMKMVLRMAEDMQNVPVHDLLVRTDAGLNAVLTVSSDFFTAATNEYLRSGQFRVVGKVTRSLAAGDTINLTRRTVLGAARPETAQDIIDSFQSDEIDLDVAEALVQGPCVQILPMAIFI